VSIKTPEEMAEKWLKTFPEGGDCCEIAFLAGYKAAQEHAHAALEEAEARHEAYVLAAEENFKRLEAKLNQVVDGNKMMNEFDAMLEEKELVNIKLRDAFYRSLNFLICNESVPVFRLNDILFYVGHLEDVLMARNSSEKPEGSNSSKNSNGWISVRERLPEIGEWVLINGPEVCQRIEPPSASWKAEYAWNTDHESFYYPEDITHWMPLPDMPKEEE